MNVKKNTTDYINGSTPAWFLDEGTGNYKEYSTDNYETTGTGSVLLTNNSASGDVWFSIYIEDTPPIEECDHCSIGFWYKGSTTGTMRVDLIRDDLTMFGDVNWERVPQATSTWQYHEIDLKAFESVYTQTIGTIRYIRIFKLYPGDYVYVDAVSYRAP